MRSSVACNGGRIVSAWPARSEVAATMAEQTPAALSIVISAMGGQGGGVLSRWIVDIAEQGGYLAQATSVPGVAQRTGATIYYIELFPRAAAEAIGRDPVLALMPIPGHVDLLIAAELVEAGRAVLRGLVSADRTTVIASSHREYAVVEKAALGDGMADSGAILEALQSAARQCLTFDMASRAASTGSVISSVLLGALASSGRLPFERAEFEAAIERSGLATERSLAGFAAGFAGAVDESEEVAASLRSSSVSPSPLSEPAKALHERVQETFPQVVRPLVIEGARRAADYQDLRYAGAYLDRLGKLHKLDGGGADGSYRLTSETARHLALWMSYEDAARVADLKTRSERFERMRQEVAAEPGQLVYAVEFMHPSVQEFTDALPAPIGRFIMTREYLRAGIDKLINHGRRVPTGKLRGFVLLRCIASLRRVRRSSYRYAREMRLIDRWLANIADVAVSDYELAVEIARCQRLIKGYGETHARGMRNFNTIMEARTELQTRDDAAGAVRRLGEAALVDESGDALRAALAALAL